MESSINIQQLVDMNYATPENCKFYIEYEEFLTMEFKGEIYQNVGLHRALPFKQPDEYISVQDFEAKELALIRDMKIFSKEQQDILNSQLEKRYFSPEITAISSVKNKMGYLYFEVGTTAGRKSFALTDVTRRLRKLEDSNTVLIIDVDGNRYHIPDVTKLPKQDFKRIRTYLF